MPLLLSSFLKDQLDKPSEDSKKWRMAMVGLKGIAGFFVVGAALFFVRPALAPQVTILVQFALSAWGGIVAMYLGAQGSVDFKTTAALQNTNHTETHEEHLVQEQHIFVEGESGAPEKRPWGQHAAGEEG